jgi:hypothetical protein
LYCYTYVSNLMCVFNELILWTEISKEHPEFIMTLASLTNKNLSSKTIENLKEVNKSFSLLQKNVKELQSRVKYGMKIHCSYIITLKEYMEAFLVLDKTALSVLEEARQYGKEDMVWQTLLEHISEEQTYMFEAVSNIKKQFK